MKNISNNLQIYKANKIILFEMAPLLLITTCNLQEISSTKTCSCSCGISSHAHSRDCFKLSHCGEFFHSLGFEDGPHRKVLGIQIHGAGRPHFRPKPENMLSAPVLCNICCV